MKKVTIEEAKTILIELEETELSNDINFILTVTEGYNNYVEESEGETNWDFKTYIEEEVYWLKGRG